MQNLDDGSIPVDQFDSCSMSAVLPQYAFAVYNEVEAYRYNPETESWNGPYVYFDTSRPWMKRYSSVYLSVWASELDLSMFNSECYSNSCDTNNCEENEFCKEEWVDNSKTYLCCESDDVCRSPG